MSLCEPITLCLTIGKRPKELEQTLDSLLSKMAFKQVIAVNDFRDDPTNHMFKALCPQGVLINFPYQQGHHAAVDAMYACVQTPYIFHCEDDWLFEGKLDVQQHLNALNERAFSQICFRPITDLAKTEGDQEKLVKRNVADVDYYDLTGLHDQWHGFSFNPHIIATQQWFNLGGYGQFKKERHISRFLRKNGQHTAYYAGFRCLHIGHESVANNVSKRFLDRFL